MSSTPNTYDVIIAGAGPVGLFLAAELALHRCSVLVLEQEAEPVTPLKQMPFGLRGLNALSIEALDRRGLLDELQLHKRLKSPHAAAPGAKPAGSGHFAGLPFNDALLEPAQWPYRLPGATPTHLMTELAELEAVLSRRAETLGVSIRRGLPLSSFQPDTEGVTVQAGGHTFRGQWLVGCDGSRSVVRKQGGFDFVGTEPEFTGYTAQVELAEPALLGFGRHVTPQGMYLQSQPGYLILQEFDGGAFRASGQPLTREHLQAVLRRISGTDATIRALHRATTWGDRTRQASTYRRGRVLLAGDAAHIHSPLGGQGLNLGLGDALNLGWKLAATLHHQAPPALLDTYTAERHPVGASVLDWSRAQVALMRPDPGAQALRTLFRQLMDTPDGATYLAGRAWGLLTRYDLGDPQPLVGRSAPNFALPDGATLPQHLRPGTGLLLAFEPLPALAALSAAYGPRLPLLTTTPGEVLGVRALLLRPDGIVAWAAPEAAAPLDLPALQQAAARWFGPPGPTAL